MRRAKQETWILMVACVASICGLCAFAIVIPGIKYARSKTAGRALASDESAPRAPEAEGAATLIKQLKGIGPVECLRVYRVKVLSRKGEYSPWGDIWTRYTAELEAAYGSSPAGQGVQFLVQGGTVGKWSRDVSGPGIHLNVRYVLAMTDQTDPACSHFLGRSEQPDPAFGLLLGNPNLVGRPDGDSIRFDGLGVSVDSVGLCRIVESITSGRN